MAPAAAPAMAFQLQNFFEPWLNSTPERRQQFLQDPRGAMEEIVGVPSDIRVVVESSDNQIWFQASSCPKRRRAAPP